MSIVGLVKGVAIVLMICSAILAVGQFATSVAVLTLYSSPYDKYLNSETSKSCYEEYQLHAALDLFPSKTHSLKAEGWKFCRDNNIVKAAADIGIIAALYIAGGALCMFFKNTQFTIGCFIFAFLLSFVSSILPFTMRYAHKGYDSEAECAFGMAYRLYVNDREGHSANSTVSPLSTEKPPLKMPPEPPNHQRSEAMVKTRSDRLNRFEHGRYNCWKGGIHDFHLMSEERIRIYPKHRSMYQSAIAFLVFSCAATIFTAGVSAVLIVYFIKTKNRKIGPDEDELEATKSSEALHRHDAEGHVVGPHSHIHEHLHHHAHDPNSPHRHHHGHHHDPSKTTTDASTVQPEPPKVNAPNTPKPNQTTKP